jgi:FkbM family methyltransferase
VLKQLLRSLANLTGYEIMTLDRARAEWHCLRSILAAKRINLVVDVGANSGQFGQWIRKVGYKGRLISFEPLPAAHARLREAASSDNLWTVAPRMALGRESGTININVAANSVSSSILPMLAAHVDAAPQSAYTAVETTPLNRLDDVCTLLGSDHLLLKIDVQGYEKAVLDGAPKLLTKCEAIMLEMSLKPLYQGQSLAIDLWGYLRRKGFEACYFHPGFCDPRSKQMLQMDGIFIRDNCIPKCPARYTDETPVGVTSAG